MNDNQQKENMDKVKPQQIYVVFASFMDTVELLGTVPEGLDPSQIEVSGNYTGQRICVTTLQSFLDINYVKK